MSGTDGHYTAPVTVPPAQDFWRTPQVTGGALPDGTNDTSEPVARTGLVGVGGAFAAGSAVAMMDVAVGGRSGTDGRVAGVTPLYVTGSIPALSGANTTVPTPVGANEFRHANQTQGIGIAYNGLFSTGSNVDQDFTVQNRGNGQFNRNWQNLLGGFAYDNENVSTAVTVPNTGGFQHRWWGGDRGLVGVDLFRRNTGMQGGTFGWERFWQMQRPDGTFTNHSRQTWSFSHPLTPAFSVNPSNQVGDQLLTLWGDPAAGAGTYSIGIRPSEMVFVKNAGAAFRFRNGGAGVADGRQFVIDQSGNVTVDPTGTAPAGFAAPVLRFGDEGSQTAIKSNRATADANQNGLEFYTAAAQRMVIRQNGRIFIAPGSMPLFASDAAAGAAGLLQGELFRDALGGVHWKL